jgi:hypothetical protein
MIDDYEELLDFFNFNMNDEEDEKDPDEELLEELEKMLAGMFPEDYNQPKDVTPEEVANKCKHKWKKIPGFLANSFYEVCEICGVDKEDD